MKHTGSAEQLLGKNATMEKLVAYSNQLQVSTEIPPTFLVAASDDGGVSPINSIEMQ